MSLSHHRPELWPNRLLEDQRILISFHADQQRDLNSGWFLMSSEKWRRISEDLGARVSAGYGAIVFVHKVQPKLISEFLDPITGKRWKHETSFPKSASIPVLLEGPFLLNRNHNFGCSLLDAQDRSSFVFYNVRDQEVQEFITQEFVEDARPDAQGNIVVLYRRDGNVLLRNISETVEKRLAFLGNEEFCQCSLADTGLYAELDDRSLYYISGSRSTRLGKAMLDSGVSVAPSGRSVAWWNLEENRCQLKVFHNAGSGPEALYEYDEESGEVNPVRPSWSRDDRFLLTSIHRYGDAGSVLLVFDLNDNGRIVGRYPTGGFASRVYFC